MNPWVRHLIEVAASVVVLAGAYVLLFLAQLGAPVAAEYWVHDMKVAKLYQARRTPERKIVVVGGSNAMLGIDSAMIEKATGIRTVNLAVHGALPLEYLVAYAKGAVRPGDVIVMLLEYEYYWAGGGDGAWFRSNIMAWEEAHFWALSAGEKLKFICSVPAGCVLNGVIASLYAPTLRRLYGRGARKPGVVVAEAREVWEKQIYKQGEFAYSLRGLNEHGDLQNNRGARYKGEFASILMFPFPYSRTAWDALAGFRRFCDEQGIDLLLGWPATLGDSYLEGSIGTVRGHMKAIADRVKALEIRTLGSPEDFILDKRYFFDTNYHLNEEGRRLRTEELLPYLRKELSVTRPPRTGSATRPDQDGGAFRKGDLQTAASAIMVNLPVVDSSRRASRCHTAGIPTGMSKCKDSTAPTGRTPRGDRGH